MADISKRTMNLSALLLLLIIVFSQNSGLVRTIFGLQNPPLPKISKLEVSPFVYSWSEYPSGILHENANKLGDNVTIRFVVKNNINHSHVYTVPLQIENETFMIDVELEALGTKTAYYTFTPEIVGFYHVKVDGLTGGFYVWPIETKTAEFKVSRLRLFTEIEEGADITIFVNVSNVGHIEGTHRVDLRLDGEVVYSKNVTLPVGASEEVPLLIEDGLTAGAHQVEVEALTGSFTVNARTSFWDMIPGFPYGSIIFGIAAGVFTLLLCTRAPGKNGEKVSHSLLRTLPGVAPVCSVFSTIFTPLTITYSMPSGCLLGSSGVAATLILGRFMSRMSA